MIILLHSSKTMRPAPLTSQKLASPQLLDKAKHLDDYLKTLSAPKLAKIMHISAPLAAKSYALIQHWSINSNFQQPAIDAFLGDIFSGLQAIDWTSSDRQYANHHLRILSGLYGILRPLDGIYPYRLELGYRLIKKPFANLYNYWQSDVAATLPADGPIINLAAQEYSQLVTPFVAGGRIITPTFLTLSPKTSQPTFVVVHAKIARGAFARWLITAKISDPKQLPEFEGIGYRYSQELSRSQTPAFVCSQFAGKGLSLRLK